MKISSILLSFSLSLFLNTFIISKSALADTSGGSNFSQPLALNVSASEWSQIPNGRVRWLKLNSKDQQKLKTKQNDVINFGLHIELDPEWHTYWQNPGDSGAPPEIYLKTAETEDKKIEIHYPYPERIEVGPLVTYGYSHQLIYFFEAPEEEFSFRADLLVCKEECIPGSSAFSSRDKLTDFNSDEGITNLIASELTKLPQASAGRYVQGLSQIEWSMDLPARAKIVDLFWTSESLNDLSLPSFVKSAETTKFFTTQDSLGPNEKKSALLVYELDSKVHSQMISFEKTQAELFWFFLMAFIGGMILNLMPCVFPIVSIKAFSVLKTSGQALLDIRKQNLAYSAGVIFCFILMGLLLSLLRSSGAYLGWGFQLQNPYVVFSLAVVFFILALSFFDVWSWNWVPKFATKYYAENSLWTSFLTGLLAVIVASPCTAPFMGAAIGFAITQSTLAILIVFLGLGLGMSLPFLLMALFPQVSKYLPKPGAWMIHFKKIMGVMLLLTVAWLLWVLVQLIQPNTAKDLENWNALKVEQWSEVLGNTEHARFVNFTADWCVTCKVNERLVFSQDQVQEHVNQNQIRMYKVDWTKREDSIARKLSEFGRVGVPLYLYFPKGSKSPIVLNELLTPQGFISNLKSQDSNSK